MKAFKWMPILIVLVVAKLIISGLLLYNHKYKWFSPSMALAKAVNPSSKDLNPEIETKVCPPEVFDALRIERERIRQREKELEKKAQHIALMEKEIRQRLASLGVLEEEIDKKLKKLQVVKSERFKLLVGAYSNMKPSKAAKLLEAMEPEMAIKILSSLRTEQVARILSAMPPEKAASLAESLSGLPPKEM